MTNTQKSIEWEISTLKQSRSKHLNPKILRPWVEYWFSQLESKVKILQSTSVLADLSDKWKTTNDKGDEVAVAISIAVQHFVKKKDESSYWLEYRGFQYPVSRHAGSKDVNETRFGERWSKELWFGKANFRLISRYVKGESKKPSENSLAILAFIAHLDTFEWIDILERQAVSDISGSFLMSQDTLDKKNNTTTILTNIEKWHLNRLGRIEYWMQAKAGKNLTPWDLNELEHSHLACLCSTLTLCFAFAYHADKLNPNDTKGGFYKDLQDRFKFFISQSQYFKSLLDRNIDLLSTKMALELDLNIETHPDSALTEKGSSKSWEIYSQFTDLYIDYELRVRNNDLSSNIIFYDKPLSNYPNYQKYYLLLGFQTLYLHEFILECQEILPDNIANNWRFKIQNIYKKNSNLRGLLGEYREFLSSLLYEAVYPSPQNLSGYVTIEEAQAGNVDFEYYLEKLSETIQLSNAGLENNDVFEVFFLGKAFPQDAKRRKSVEDFLMKLFAFYDDIAVNGTQKLPFRVEKGWKAFRISAIEGRDRIRGYYRKLCQKKPELMQTKFYEEVKELLSE